MTTKEQLIDNIIEWLKDYEDDTGVIEIWSNQLRLLLKEIKKIEENSSMIVVDLSYEGKSLHRNFHCFTTEKNLILKRPSVSMKRIDLPGNISRFEISVNYFAKNVELSINNETGGFTDNYFDMIPDTKYVIDHYSAEPLKPNEGLNIRSLIDTY